MKDGKAFGQEMVGIVKSYMERTLTPVLERIKALEDRQPERGEKGDPGQDGKDGSPGADGRDGKDADMDAIRELIAAEVKAAVDAIPAPENGKDGADGKDGEPGRDADMEALTARVDEVVAEQVERAVSAIPVPEDGKDGRDGIDGKDGVGLADALINRGGGLVLTLTNGTARELGPVVGRDGEKGDPGRDGADGFGFEDLEVVQSDVKDFTFRFTKGERVKEFSFSLPVVVDRGVFKEGQTYQPGDGVTWGGSFWIAQGETKEKPGTGEGWRLAVKKGRDGKDGKMVEAQAKSPIKVGPGKKDDAQ